MIDLRSVRIAIVSLAVLVATAGAQTHEGLSFDQTITQVSSAPGHYDSSTNVVHMVSAGSSSRMEMDNNTIYPKMGAFTPGQHAVLLLRENGTETTFLNPEKKEYLSMKPLELMAGFKKMLEGMGGSMTVDSSHSYVHFDSLGPGPVIDGHPTLHYRMDAAVRITMSMMGQVVITQDSSTTDIFSAPDLARFRDVANPAGAFAQVSQSIGFGQDFFTKMQASRSKMQGFPLRMVRHSVQTQQGKAKTVTQTIESRNIKAVTLPDSLFAIPPGYKPIAMPVLPGAAVENLP